MPLLAYPRPKNSLRKPVWNHPEAASVNCFVCEAQFKSWKDLDQHIAERHQSFVENMIQKIRGN